MPCPEMMTPSCVGGLAFDGQRALKRPEKADERVWANAASGERSRRNRDSAGIFLDGETRTRTGDTTIFSRVLYQLSYLAVEPRG